jgi:glutamate dehydrogenase
MTKSKKAVAQKDQPVEIGFLEQMQQIAETWSAAASITKPQKHLFVAELLQGSGLRDLQKRSEDEAEKTLRALWDSFQRRPFEEIRIDIQEEPFGHNDRVDITLMQRQIPFVTDSIMNLLSRNNLTIDVMLNATFKVRRDDDGSLLTIYPDEDEGPDLQADKLLHIQCDHRGEILDPAALRQQLSDTLRDVHAAVEDWRSMQGQVAETIDDLEDAPPATQKDESFEAAAFLSFLQDGNFTFLGYREHTVQNRKGTTYYDIIPDKSLGMLRDQEFLLFDGLITDDLIPPQVSAVLFNPEPVMVVLKANRRSTVHRNVHMDVILVKRYNAKGEVVALRLFSGLFTSQCYAKPTDQIPYLKQKVSTVLSKSGFDPMTHAWRSLKHVLDNYPRDELFLIDTDRLYEHAMGINLLNSRPDLDVFIRPDILHRYYSVLVYVPKEEYDTKIRLKVQQVTEEHLHGVVAAQYITIDEKPLARLLYMIATESVILPEYDIDVIRQKLIEVCTPWEDRMKKAALAKFGKKEMQRLLQSMNDAFSVSYKDQVLPQHALEDLEPLHQAMRHKEMVVTLHRREDDQPEEYRVKVYKRGSEASLSELLPVLDRMGFQCNYEYSYLIQPRDGLPEVWIHDLVGKIDVLDKDRIAEIEPLFAETFEKAWHKKVDSDSFNSLVLAAALTWREANLFRGFARYLDLARYPLGRRYMSQVLAKYAPITRRLCDAFLMRHNPALDRAKADEDINAVFVEIDQMLDKVEKLDEDKVLRSMIALIRETLRTNYFHTDGDEQPLDQLILKFNSQALNDLPQPRPFKEIFLFSPRVEAVHLRGGPIARGGIRWSDRFEDFRTEIMGLVKAQMVKNSVIVPVGAKGGFICKELITQKTPQERIAEGIACYQTMVKGYLSITDNIVDGKIVPPNNTVRHDGDDPYFVVAADKGTASFSDIANKISLDHGFWLGDAFASGGSKGYDHKGMGITARGAWECIKRHFREMGKDIQSEDFTVAGVGDMSGDVFGNGMLLSEHIKLVAVFDHRHIFVDPNPDPKKSFAERKRLFEKAGSSWMDYDPKLLSTGGMIYSRQEKSLTLTPEIQALLDIGMERVTPNDLMQAILRSRVELMYFGGIGTYVKASYQTHEQVGDKGSDLIRVNASTLRCKVIGEGANLATTQLARIEFAQRGGRINTDFVDNSAGVDTSDHEVNIKILLQPMVNSNKMAEADREKLLVSMTEDVGSHVLKNNYDQSLALSLLEQRSKAELMTNAQFMRHLERDGLLDRKIEDLPDDETIQRLAQRHEGLSRPELAVVLAYSKMTLFKQLMDSSLPDDEAITHQAMEYFPDVLQQRFPKEIEQHKLKRDIVATEVANVIINRMGPTFVAMKQWNGGEAVDQIAKAWLVTRAVFDLRTLWNEIDKLDNKIPADVQFSLYNDIIEVLSEGVKWFIKHHGSDLSLEKLIPLYRDQLTLLHGVIVDVLPDSLREQMQAQQDKLDGYETLRPDVKKRLVQLPTLLAGCDVVYLKQQANAKADDVAKVYFTLSQRLHVSKIMQYLDMLPADNSWKQEAIDGLQDEVQLLLNEMTKAFLQSGHDVAALGAWLDQRHMALSAVDSLMNDMARLEGVDLSLLTVIVKRLHRVVVQGG